MLNFSYGFYFYLFNYLLIYFFLAPFSWPLLYLSLPPSSKKKQTNKQMLEVKDLRQKYCLEFPF